MISRDEWLKALGDAVAPTDPDALTVQEVARQFGIHRQSAYRKLNLLVEQGKAIRTRKMIITGDGHEQRVPAYKLVKGKR